MTRIGIVGLGLKNPYTFVPILNEMDAEVVAAYDCFPALVDDFCKAFGCRPVYDMQEFPFDEVDGVMIESINKDHLELAQTFIDKGIPCYIEKPLSNSSDSALSFIEKNKGKLWFSASPLRFSPLYRKMAQDIADNNERLNYTSVAIYHTMEHFLANPEKTWHDRVSEGGGMLVDIGIHAIEILNLLNKGCVKRTLYTSTKCVYRGCESGDLHHITIQYDDDSIAGVSIVCCTDHLDYKVECNSLHRHYINSNETPYIAGDYSAANAYGGFEGTIKAFLKMVRERSVPIDMNETKRNFDLIRKIEMEEKQ